ncbi:MAG TPA: hypothetical protein ENJ57_07265 [Rhizobiales bacterium]|nr:hypothetical protein [Hyphomicrobiales bacterium]
MRKILAAFAMLAVLVLPASARTYKLDNGEISFEAPDEFKPMSKELIRLKYPRGTPPRYVLATASTQTSIAYDLKPHNIPQKDIEKLRTAFTRLLPRIIPGLKWIDNRIIDLSGQKWVLLEMTSHAIDTDIHNIMLLTGHKGQMLVFNFNSTKKEFPKHEAALRKAIKSINLKTPPVGETPPVRNSGKK